MRLRKLTTVSTIRRHSVGKHFAAFQLALTLSIAGASSTNAQTDLPELPQFPAAITSPAQSLPIVYPFESRQQRLERTSNKLLGILGLSTRSPNEHRGADHSTQTSPSQAFALQASVTQGVIPAAATEPEKLELPTANGVCQAKLESPCYAELKPTCEAATPLTCVEAQPLACESTDQSDCKAKISQVCETHANDAEAAVSLIDIDIPLDAPKPEIASSPSALPILELTTREPEVVIPKRTMSLLIEAPKLKSEVAAEQISQRRSERKQVKEDAVAVPVAPLMLEEPESLGVTANLSDDPKDADEDSGFAFSFSDSDVPSDVPSRQAALHLSSASSTSTSLSDAAEMLSPPQPLPQKKLTVRIEGEPAVVMESADYALAEPESAVTHNLSDHADSNEAAPPERLKVSLASLVTHQENTEVTHQENTETAEASTAKREYLSGPSVNLQSQDATVINLGHSVSQISVENPAICQAMQTSANSLSVVGLEAGNTRLAIVSKNSDGSTAVEIRDVTVTQTQQSRAVKATSLAEEMNATVARLFPAADVEVIAVDEGLMVQGVADSEADARKILSLVRKASLKPVIDRLRAPK